MFTKNTNDMYRFLPFFLFVALLSWVPGLMAQNIFAPRVQIWEGYDASERIVLAYCGDFDDDGHNDALIRLISGSGYPSRVLRRNDGTGLLSAQVADFDTAQVYALLGWLDVDGDGRDELLTGPFFYRVMDDSTFTRHEIVEGDQGYRYMSHGLINDDEHVDLLLIKSSLLYAAYGDGQGGYTLTAILTNFPYPPFQDPSYSGPIIADMNGDGLPDIVCYYYHNFQRVRVLLQQPDGTFQVVTTTLLNEGGGSALPANMQVVDFDHDGELDIVFKAASAFHVLRQAGGAFNVVDIVPFNTSAGIFADFDMDGFPEFLQPLSNGPLRMLRRNSSTGLYATSGASLLVLNTMRGYEPVVVDYDGDGDLDILVQHLTQPGFRAALFFYENLTINLPVSSSTEIEPAATHRMAPMPFRDVLQVEWLGSANARLYVTDLSGRAIHEQVLTPGSNGVNLPAQLPSGVYAYRIVDASGKWAGGGRVVKG